MDKKLPDFIYYLLRILGDAILISLIKTMFTNSMTFDQKTKKTFMLLCYALVVLNILGIFRNSFTLWKYENFMSYFWLGADILQLIYCVLLWCIGYFKDHITPELRKVLLYTSFIFCGLNIYNFLINFKYINTEGILVFVFWFINNGGMVIFSAFIAYLIYSKKLKSKLSLEF
jgi:hypothetical protein